MIQDILKLLGDSGKVPKPNGVVGGSIPGCEIVFLFDRKKIIQVVKRFMCS
jgi:hypothetical protein